MRPIHSIGKELTVFKRTKLGRDRIVIGPIRMGWLKNPQLR